MTRSFFALLLCAAPAAAQNTTLDALLNEVRQLRLAIERSNTIGPRMQLLMQRAQIQDAKVTRLARDLQDVRSNLAHFTGEVSTARAALEQVESKITQEQNPALRTQLEEMRQHFKTQLDTQSAEEQQLRSREVELSSQLRLEQANLDALQTKLDALDKALDLPHQ
jgi:chromosome segregation ATPase